MVRLIRSQSERARYWHRVDDQGCSDSRLVQPEKDDQETDVAAGDLGEFFEYADKEPCPDCRWDHH